MSPITVRELEQRVQNIERAQEVEKIYRENLQESLKQISDRLEPLNALLLEIRAINNNIKDMQEQLNKSQCRLDVLERADYNKFLKNSEQVKENLIKVVVSAAVVSVIGFLAWAAKLYMTKG